SSRRISEDEALHRSLAGGKAAAAPAAAEAEEDLPADDEVAAATGDQAEALRARIEAAPTDLEAHICLLRLLHSRGDAGEYERAAQAMRVQVRSTLDPRWREAAVMGLSLLPGNPLFQQSGWNAPRFGDTGVMPAPAAPAPEQAQEQEQAPEQAQEPEPEPEQAQEAAAELEAGLDADAASAQEASGVDEFGFGDAADAGDALSLDTAVEIELAGAEAGGDASAVPASPPLDDDASATKIELARAYLDIGDVEGAKAMLEEVIAEAGPAGRAEAEKLLKEIG